MNYQNSVICASKRQVSCDLGGEAAILNLDTGIYYGLDPIGAKVWFLLERPRSFAEISAALVDEYDVHVDQCRRDLDELLASLEDAGLIEIVSRP